jgi:hypothetical protein
MSSSSDSSTPRREFIGALAASAIAIAGTACASPASAVQTAVTPAPTPNAPVPPPAPAEPVHWDDSWFAKLTAKHKAVFDSPDFGDGIALQHATGYIRGMRDALAASLDDVQTVIVMRHHAIPMAFNDAMWEKYSIGEERKVKDSANKWATRNPFAVAEPSTGAHARPNTNAGADRPQANLGWFASHGQILLGCDMATRGYAAIIASKTKSDSRAIYDELKANLLPGVILQPTGVYAVLRAQEAGCAFFKST